LGERASTFSRVARISGVISAGFPSGVHNFHGSTFMSASAKRVCTSSSSGKREATSRMASA
jgi:hypothetical protein